MTSARQKSAPRKSPARRTKPTESKSDKFVRLANRRVSVALDRIDSVGKLANARAYDYTPEQTKRITDALASAIKSVNDRFAAPTEKGKAAGFQL